MILRFLYQTRNFCSAFTLSKTNKMNLEKCYFRYVQKEETVDITFLFKVKDAVRQFNFSRKPTENLSSLFCRMSANIQKALKKAHKKKEPQPSEVKIVLHDVKDNSISEQSTCWDLFGVKGPVHLKIDCHIYEAVFNAPWVVSLQLPQSILAGFAVHPEYFVTQYAEKELTIFRWYKAALLNEKGNAISESHMNWELVGEGFSYTPTALDIGMKLKIECIPGNNETKGPAVEAVSKTTIEAGPGPCPFETRHLFTQSRLKDKCFRCVTYNILADLYCDSEFTRTVLHPYCPPYALNIDYRKQLILKELTGFNADIMCLQEVDTKIFNNYLQPLLETDHFQGLFYKKGKEVAEGLALFYRKDRFKLLGEEKIVMSEAIQSNPSLKSIWVAVNDNIPLKTRLLDRSTAASATFLQSLNCPNEILIVGNTHLYFHPNADHIRLIQGGIFIYWLNDLKVTLSQKFSGKKISLILCGDFNSVPSCGIYQLYTTGSSPSSLPDWQSISIKDPHIKNKWILATGKRNWFPTVYSRLCSSHFHEEDFNPTTKRRILLKDAYPTIELWTTTAKVSLRLNPEEAVCNLSLQQKTLLESACGTPQFTNFTAGFADCLDYIFYDKAGLKVIQVVPLPSLEELTAHTALPSIVFPSDHISLVSDLEFL